MNRLPLRISTAVLAAALITTAPVAAQAAVPAPPAATADPTCDDPTQIIPDFTSFTEVAVGTTKVQTLPLVLSTVTGCGVTRATATVQAPRRTVRVALEKIGTEGGLDFWEGGLAVDPTALRNSDAGVWPTTFAVTGDHQDSLTVPNRVLRASRISFNAGPEPVRNNRLTYTGKVRRASWSTHRYVADGDRRVEVGYQFDPHEEGDVVARPLTRASGRYRVSRQNRGSGW